MQRTFQKGNRLWSVESVGKRVTTTWGRSGGKTQSKSAAHGSAGAAKARLWADARLKLQAGYVETTFRGDLPLTDPTAKGLLAALAENPGDLATHMAFADWLGEQADDRLTSWGEFMRLQIALEVTPPKRKGKSPEQKRLEELRDDYEMHWLGEALAVPLLGMGTDDVDAALGLFARTRTYARGWLDSLAVFDLNKALARAMGKATALRLLKTLTISDPDEEGSLAVLAKSSVLDDVRNLSFLAYGPDRGLYSLIRSMPRLESLRLGVSGLPTATLFAMPELSSLDTIEVGGPERYSVESLAMNPVVENLRRLALNTVAGLDDFFVDDYIMGEPGQLGDEEIHTICYSPRLKGLRELALHGVLIDFVGCHALADSGILSRLDVLDLARGSLDDSGAGILASSPDFARIPRVILDENFISPSMVRRLRQINKGVRAKDQGERPDEEVFDDDWE